MNSKTAIALAIVAALATAPAYAKPKPIKGTYKCKGTVSVSSSIGAFSSGQSIYGIKGKLGVKRQTFALAVTTAGQQVLIAGTFPSDYQPTFVPSFAYENGGFKALTAGCPVYGLRTSGTGAQTRNGRKVDIDFTQSYQCGLSSSILRVDRYRMTCKR